MSDWRKITCAERDQFFRTHNLGVYSGFTDMDGEYGDPQIFTEWCDKPTGQPVLRDRRYPSRTVGEPDQQPCQHHVAAETAARNDERGMGEA